VVNRLVARYTSLG